MVLYDIGPPLVIVEHPDPLPLAGELSVNSEACAVCRTDLHVLDGDLKNPKLPLVPGNEIVGIVEAVGEGVSPLRLGSRVGIPWLGHTCGHCDYCRSHSETSATNPSSQVIRATVGLPPMPSRMRISLSIFPSTMIRFRLRHFCAPG